MQPYERYFLQKKQPSPEKITMPAHYLIPRKLAKRFSAWRHGLWRAESWITRALLWFFRCLPINLSIVWLGRLVQWAGPRTAKWSVVKHNLTTAFPDQSEADIDQLSRRVFHTLGVTMAEIIHAANIWAQRDKRLRFVVAPGVAITAQRPMIFVSAHVGAWPFNNFVARQYQLPFSIVYTPASNPYLDEWYPALYGVNMIAKKGALRSLMRELAAGRSIGLLADNRLSNGEKVPFFNIDTYTNTVPAQLALRYLCDLVPMHVTREPNHGYTIHIGAPIKPSNPDDDLRAQIRDMTQQLNRLFEAWIRMAPDQWLCLTKRWSNR